MPTNANLACAGPDAGGLDTWTSSVGAHEDLPIGCVNWFEAYAFCIWDGGFLPSEAEWEYAAAGGSEQRDFPWGPTLPGTVNMYAIYDEYWNGNPTQIAPVGSALAGAARWGQLDMAGELYEWVLDYWKGSFVDPCHDCAYLTASSGQRVQKTQRFGTGPSLSFLVPPYRTSTDPTARNYTLGFRCARAP
jgi:formylglycine-generating enzyme required for sulfatase activity